MDFNFFTISSTYLRFPTPTTNYIRNSIIVSKKNRKIQNGMDFTFVCLGLYVKFPLLFRRNVNVNLRQTYSRISYQHVT